MKLGVISFHQMLENSLGASSRALDWIRRESPKLRCLKIAMSMSSVLLWLSLTEEIAPFVRSSWLKFDGVDVVNRSWVRMLALVVVVFLLGESFFGKIG